MKFDLEADLKAWLGSSISEVIPSCDNKDNENVEKERHKCNGKDYISNVQS